MDMGERNEYTLSKYQSHWNLLNKLFPLTRPPLQLLNNIKSTRKIKTVWDSRSLPVCAEGAWVYCACLERKTKNRGFLLFEQNKVVMANTKNTAECVFYTLKQRSCVLL